VLKQVSIKDIQHMRRSMVDNRCLILMIVQMTDEGRKQIQFMNLVFSSIFKLF
jgi:hypothetical protein